MNNSGRFPAKACPKPHRVLMTVDAVGGVWRYAVDLAEELREHGVETVFAGFGPPPSPELARQAQEAGELCWCDAPLDWMARDESEVSAAPWLVADLASRHAVDLVHLNLPSQAAGLELDVPVVTVSHSCVVTWFEAVRGAQVPADWHWQARRNLAGFLASDAVLAPSRSHADAIRRCYGFTEIQVVHNSSRHIPRDTSKEDFVFAAGRWWDEGKNGAVLDQAAAASKWPVVMAGATRSPKGERFAIRHAESRNELSHGATMKLLGSAAIFVSPSIYEPFGLAALEAARAGAALVLSDIPTYRELWSDAALFVNPRNPEEFARTINHLAETPALRRDYGNRARLRARDYAPHRQGEAIAAIYRRVLEREPALSALG